MLKWIKQLLAKPHLVFALQLMKKIEDNNNGFSIMEGFGSIANDQYPETWEEVKSRMNWYQKKLSKTICSELKRHGLATIYNTNIKKKIRGGQTGVIPATGKFTITSHGLETLAQHKHDQQHPEMWWEDTPHVKWLFTTFVAVIALVISIFNYTK